MTSETAPLQGRKNKPSTPRAERLPLTWYAAIFLHYSAICLPLVFFYRHELDADGTSYISLAQKYLAGDFSHVVAGHWAPMISWLILPSLSLRLEPILAFRATSYLIGVVALLGIQRFMAELNIARSIQAVYLFALGPIIAWHAENDLGADLLCACILIFYVLSVARDRYAVEKHAGTRAGLLGGLAYLAKNYNFYFFALHFTSLNLYYWIKAPDAGTRKRTALNFIAGLAAFAIVSGTWVGLLSQKYHRLTAGTAGAMSLLLVKTGPDGYPMLTGGLLPPPNDTAFSVWEDPASMTLPTWSPLDSKEDFERYLRFIPANVYRCIKGLAINMVFALTVAYFALKVFQKRPLDKKVAVTLFTILLYPIGYLMLYYDGQRYILISTILLYVLSAYAMHSFFGTSNNARLKFCASAALYLFLSLLTTYRVYNDYRLDVSELNKVFETSSEIERYCDIRDHNIASLHGSWNHALDLCYFLHGRYFGRLRENESDQELLSDLAKYHISYLFVFGELKNHLDMLQRERTFGSGADGLTIYRVQNRALQRTHA